MNFTMNATLAITEALKKNETICIYTSEQINTWCFSQHFIHYYAYVWLPLVALIAIALYELMYNGVDLIVIELCSVNNFSKEENEKIFYTTMATLRFIVFASLALFLLIWCIQNDVITFLSFLKPILFGG